MKYRREIDGLRALAVLPVILYHAGFRFMSGGFIGVDVFFVISGFLITSLILDDLQHGTYSITKFYTRRARRILPALFAVMLACIPFGLMWMLPSQYEEFSQSLMAVVFFISNIFFWSKSGYFAAESSEKPLLHTWSLGVEEQFYVLFPLFLMLTWHFGRRYMLPTLVFTALASFAACEIASRHIPSANFYLLPTRAWELLIGSICAYVSLHYTLPKQRFTGLLGMAAIVSCAFLFNDHMRLPSALMLIPVLGTAAILLFGTAGSLAAQILSLPVFVGVGLISYSAYLWHHPLFAFARIYVPSAPTGPIMLGLSAASLLLGALTWRYIEQPFRQKNHPRYVPNARALKLAMAVALLLLGIGIWGYVSHGRLKIWEANASRQQVQAYRLIETAKNQPRFYDNEDCVFNVTDLTQAAQERIVDYSRKYGPGLALIGDSHGINLFHALRQSINDRPYIIGISQGMCRPHTPNAICYYDDLLAMLKRHPHVFRQIIYEQAGWHLLTNAPNREIDERDLKGLPLDATVPDYAPHLGYIAAVKKYLVMLSAYSKVTWLGSHTEPQIRER